MRKNAAVPATSNGDEMNKLLLIVTKQSETVDSILLAIGNMGKRIDNMAIDVSGLKSDVEILKNEEEIKTSKAREIRKLANKVVSRRLGINEDPAKRTMQEKVIDKKYRSMFSSALYSEVSDKGHLASPYSATAKKDFVDACKDIEEWYPREGIDGLKKRADENAVARKIAKEQGY